MLLKSLIIYVAEGSRVGDGTLLQSVWQEQRDPSTQNHKHTRITDEVHAPTLSSLPPSF